VLPPGCAVKEFDQTALLRECRRGRGQKMALVNASARAMPGMIFPSL
jgi:hypothetical protein